MVVCSSWLRGRPERVDVHPRRAGDAAEIRVVGGLDAGLADQVARVVALLRQRLQLLRGDLTDVAEHLRRERPVRVVADVRRRRLDAGELRRVLGEVVHHRILRRLPQEDRRDGIALMRLDRGGDLVQRNVRHARQRAELVVAVDVVLRQVGRPELDGGGGGVRDEHVPVPVEDDAARSLDRHGPGADRPRLVDVFRPGEHLQRPEPEEEHTEDEQDEAAEDGDAQRQPRRQPVRLDDALLLREEAAGPRRGVASQAAAPPWRARGPAAAASAARARTPAR